MTMLKSTNCALSTVYQNVGQTCGQRENFHELLTLAFIYLFASIPYFIPLLFEWRSNAWNANESICHRGGYLSRNQFRVAQRLCISSRAIETLEKVQWVRSNVRAIFLRKYHEVVNLRRIQWIIIYLWPLECNLGIRNERSRLFQA